jgi:hypothetical protein
MPGARPISPKTREKLAKILPRLMSPHEGEIVATIRAIERTLAAENLDFHDLVAVLTNGAAAPSAPAQQTAANPSHQEIDADGLVNLIVRIRMAGSYLSPRANDFLKSLEERALQYDRVFLTERQLQWLKSLSEKAGVV